MVCSLSRAVPAGVTGLRAWAGDASGNIGVLDLRAARLSGSLKGLTGSSRGLACHEAKPILAVVSLDRFLRLYDTQVRTHVCLTFRTLLYACITESLGSLHCAVKAVASAS